MSTGQSPSGHWTEEQFIAYLYGIGPEGRHLDGCLECRTKLAGMESQRRNAEAYSPLDDAAGHAFLMAQRRAVYAKLAQPASNAIRRWASAALTLLVLGCGVFVYEQKHKETMPADRVSDVELARDVSQMAQDSEAEPTAPLQALFD